jgi:D-alanyl-D-alanine carboxypeptidase
MSNYGSSDAEWKYSRSVIFAYIEENHGGISETFTVPYPVWRMTATVSATRTPEKARFRMILVDEQSGRILEGVEIRFPGSVTKVVAARGRPLYMIIAAENLDEFTINLEAPSDFFSP